MCDTREGIDADEVMLNTVLAVKAGEAIPIDGENCEVDEKTLIGETTALAEDCVVAKMAKLVEEARNSKSKTRRFIDKFAQYYTPVATFCALTRAATAGILIKGGYYLETLGKIKAMTFYKTGTLRGEFVVTDFQHLCDDISSYTLLYCLSDSCRTGVAEAIKELKSLGIRTAMLTGDSEAAAMYAQEQVKLLSKTGTITRGEFAVTDFQHLCEDLEELQNFPGEGIQGKNEVKNICIDNRKIAHRASGTEVEGKKVTWLASPPSPSSSSLSSSSRLAPGASFIWNMQFPKGPEESNKEGNDWASVLKPQ
ncbi:hypothetical protein NC651_039167 [Populus alba x Populus x berolinensis]|nr:hypothetical protein NC651_039167 [Populus alba x Populus x berolinensis]